MQTTWTTKNGNKVQLKDMTTAHLGHAVYQLEKDGSDNKKLQEFRKELYNRGVYVA